MFWINLALGAAVGSVLRYWCTLFWPKRYRYVTAVSIVNMFGCAVLAVLSTSGRLHILHDAVSVGFLGGLTTFSSMIAEAMTVSQRWRYLMINVIGGCVIYGLTAFVLRLL